MIITDIIKRIKTKELHILLLPFQIIILFGFFRYNNFYYVFRYILYIFRCIVIRQNNYLLM
jgi:hypothetical protein